MQPFRRQRSPRSCLELHSQPQQSGPTSCSMHLRRANTNLLDTTLRDTQALAQRECCTCLRWPALARHSHSSPAPHALDASLSFLQNSTCKPPQSVSPAFFFLSSPSTVDCPRAFASRGKTQCRPLSLYLKDDHTPLVLSSHHPSIGHMAYTQRIYARSNRLVDIKRHII